MGEFWVRKPSALSNQLNKKENREKGEELPQAIYKNTIVTIVKRKFIILLSAKTGFILMILHIAWLLQMEQENN